MASNVNALIAQGVTPTADPASTWAKLQQIRDARQNAAQQKALGAQEIRMNDLKLRQAQQAQDDEQKYRDIIAKNSMMPPDSPGSPAPGGVAGGEADTGNSAPEGGAAALGAVASGSAKSLTPQTPPPPGVPMQAAPGTNQPLHTFDVDKTIADLRRAGLHQQADALAGVALKQKLDNASADKDLAQADEARQQAASKQQERINQGHLAFAKYLIDLPDDAARERAFPFAMQNLIAMGAAHPQNAGVTYQQFGGMDALKRDYAQSLDHAQMLADEAEKRAKQLFPAQLGEANDKYASAQEQLLQQQIAQASKLLASAAESGNPSAVEQVRAGLPPALAIAFKDAKTPAQFRAIGSTPAEAATQTLDTQKEADTERDRKITQGFERQRISIEAARNQLMATAARGDKSYAASTHELDQMGKPVTDAVARLSRLNDTLAQNSPQADALVAPELMTVMAGGAGSGLRVTEAEIARTLGGRSKWESLKASINQWQLDPSKATSITDEQRKEIRTLVKVVSDNLYEKQGALNDAYTTVANSQDPNAHRQAILTARQKIFGIDSNGAAVAPPALPATLSASDVGKSYVTKAGKTVKITAVNPSDATQFKYDEVK